MTDNVLYGIDFSAKRERAHAEFLLALSQAMAPDEVLDPTIWYDYKGEFMLFNPPDKDSA